MVKDKIDTVRFSLALVLASSISAWGCQATEGAGELAQGGEEFIKTVNVQVQEVQPSAFTSYIRLTGEVEAFSDVVISAEEAGVVARFFVEKGEYVDANAPLAKIRDDVLRAQVDEAAASAALASERYERQRQLWEEERIGSEITYLEAKYQAELQAARLETLKARLARTVIRSPIAGIFDERYVDAGEMVSMGTRVARVVEVERLKVTGGVAERFARSVHAGDTARVSLSLLPDQKFLGVINYVGTTVDQRSRTFPVEVVIETPDRVIKPQMVASVEIVETRRDDALVLPQPAILRTESGYQVFVAVEEGDQLLARPRPVRLGPTYNNQVVVTEGIAAGDRVIVRGQQLVENGNRVRIVESE